MTPEEHATAAVETWLGDKWPQDGFAEFRGTGPLRDAFAEHIRAAIAAERQACALTMRMVACPRCDGEMHEHCFLLLDAAATAIRARP